jgi:carbon storage regulator
MLVITRKSHQSIFIGDEIQIRILGIQGNYTRLGIEAPRSIQIDREEIYWRIKGQLAHKPILPEVLSLPTFCHVA